MLGTAMPAPGGAGLNLDNKDYVFLPLGGHAPMCKALFADFHYTLQEIHHNDVYEDSAI
jgi:hypothetical protein